MKMSLRYVVLKCMAVVFLLSLPACNNKKPPVITDPRQTALEKKSAGNKDTTLNDLEKKRFENLNISEGKPIAFRSCNAIAIPLELEERYQDKGERIPSYFNIAVLGADASRASLVFDKPVYIDHICIFEYDIAEDGKQRYYKEEDEGYSTHFNSLIFMELYNYTDFKKGKRKLLVYDLKNDKLTQLSPDSADLQKWYVFNGSSRILMYCNFGTEDTPDENILFSDFRSAGIPQPALEKQHLLQMKKQMVKQP